MMKHVCRYLWIGLLLLAAPTLSRANDFGVDGVGGSWKPLKEKDSKIRMVKESVRIIIHAQLHKEYGFYSSPYYEVAADFTFKNSGGAVTINMAFPERGNGAIANPRQSAFTDFSTYVNGKKTQVRRVITKLEGFPDLKDASDYEYQALWIKQVSFKQGETKQVRVTYRAQPGSQAGVGFFASYDFTGENWQGNVAESVLTVQSDSHLKFLKSTFNDKNFSMRRNNQTYSARWTNWQAQGYFRFWFDRTDAALPPAQRNSWPSPGAPRYITPLTTNDLRGKSNQQLDIMRNTIYACYGRTFTRKDLQNYFNRQSWYHRNPNFRESLLTDVERRNAAFILKYQKER